MIRILFLTANPFVGTDEPPLRLYREFELIDEKIWSSKYRNKFQLIPRFSSSARRLSDYIIRFKPNIVHFSGHGTTKGELVFQDEYGESQVANAVSIKNIFGILNAGIRCVVLNSCLSERQARMISKHVDCVIGMSEEIYDQAASVFATNFYFGLASGYSVKDAYELGKVQIKLLYLKESEHNVIDVEKQSKMVKIITKANIDPSKLFLFK
jgi:hypothetical protein